MPAIGQTLAESIAAYERGDYATAHRGFLKHAEKGVASAQGALGTMYYNGEGVPQNYAVAAIWYRQAAYQGVTYAQELIGDMYYYGEGVPQDYAFSAMWYRRAADQGAAYAQGAIGLMYLHGDGVPQDYVHAYKWFHLAASGNLDPDLREMAIRNRKRVASLLSHSELSQAQRLSQEWRPTEDVNSLAPNSVQHYETGRLTYEDGSTYEGGIKNGVPHGHGTAVWANGTTYTGEFMDGEAQGQGTTVWSNGDTYTGELKDGNLHGQGTFVRTDGTTYTGEFKDGGYHGQGTFVRTDGTTYTGGFVDGEPEGAGKVTYPDGATYSGVFDSGAAERGNARAQLSLGIMYEAVYQDDDVQAFKWLDIAASRLEDPEGLALALQLRNAVASRLSYSELTHARRLVDEWRGRQEPNQLRRDTPGAPSGLTATAGHRSIALTWGDPGDASITGYEYRVHADREQGWREWRPVTGSTHETTRHTLAGLTNRVRYRVEVRARSNSGAGTPSETSATPHAPVIERAEEKSTQQIDTGRLNYDDGSTYEGEIKDGVPHGKGSLVWADGDTYTGEFEAGVRYGHGIYVFADGTKYTGGFVDGQYEGAGTITSPDGITYTGQFKDDEPHGPGTVVLADGTIYTGDFVNGEPEGAGAITYPNGTTDTGEFKDGEWRSHQYGAQEAPFSSRESEGGLRASPPPEHLEMAMVGSGFLVSTVGHILTNAHVVRGCAEVRSPADVPVQVVAYDDASDLALLESSSRSPGTVAEFRQGRGIRSAGSVLVIGYPLRDMLASEPSVSAGIVSALAGPGDDRRLIQITAPVQPGNSGGPVLDSAGNVVGVVVARLNALEIARDTGVLPQNVNFAVAAGAARAFLDAESVPYLTAPSDVALPPEAVAAAGKRFTVMVECWKPKP